MTTDKPLLVIITGLSGAGKSVAIHALEDLGFYCIDNLPLEMLISAIDFIKGQSRAGKQFALGMDVRDKPFIERFLTLRQTLLEEFSLDVIFLTADETVLAERYSSARRKHPLLDVGGELLAAIRREKVLLQPIETVADAGVDTTSLSPHALARFIEQRYQSDVPARSLYVTITSFGFKHGALQPVDTMFDVRFLPNPHFVPELKPLTGMETQVADFVLGDPLTKEFLDRLVSYFQFTLPHYYAEGKHYLRIGIGCTGGQHRSVAIAEALAARLLTHVDQNVPISVFHRDLPRVLFGKK